MPKIFLEDPEGVARQTYVDDVSQKKLACFKRREEYLDESREQERHQPTTHALPGDAKTSGRFSTYNIYAVIAINQNSRA
jgi:hypothetical protein